MARTSNATSFKPSFARTSYLAFSSFFFIGYLRHLINRHYRTQKLLPRVLGPVSLVWLANSIVVHVELYGLSDSKASYESSSVVVLPLLHCLRKLNTVNYFPDRLPCNFTFTVRPLAEITAEAVVSYFKLRTEEQVSTLDIISSLHKLLSSVVGLVGYRLELTGRYARQPRASKLTLKRGLVSLSSTSSSILFFQDFLLLKHGKCGLKVWLNKSDSFSRNSLLYSLSL